MANREGLPFFLGFLDAGEEDCIRKVGFERGVEVGYYTE